MAGQSNGSNADTGVVVGAKSTAGKRAYQTYVQVEELQKPLCGQSRPHFFRGVATVGPLSPFTSSSAASLVSAFRLWSIDTMTASPCTD